MSVIPASMQQISSRTTPLGGEQNPFLTLLSSFGQGMLQKQQQKQQLPMELMKSAFPGLVNTKQILPTQAGEEGFDVGGVKIPWKWNSNRLTVPVPLPGGGMANMPVEDVGDVNTASLITQRSDELGKLTPSVIWSEINSNPKTWNLPTAEKMVLAQEYIQEWNKQKQPVSSTVTTTKRDKAKKLLESQGQATSEANITWVLKNYGDKL